ncbi:MAG: Asp23/Gls24 family envelope stress response protein [Candidatus Dormibacteraeota bacterium]|uniref:Asp23/Gls24 family envelope stress response protein n=1 Tax=Candidatus Amunia macphersoniae TaxID=3127014 RepID=A0A934KFL3_9BACT|nr:Asp23/Gls24 family envelope stress response protein [Candidatus Dormibacteraeota bacterium]
MGSDVTSRTKTPHALSRTESLGRIEVSPRVVASIVGHAANECYGVVGMAARGLRDGIAERLNRENAHRGVEIEVRAGGILIELYIIAQYGTRISEVAHNLMSVVRYAVEKSLGLPVLAVNVNVQGIHLETDDARS